MCAGEVLGQFFKSSDLLHRSSEADNVFSMSYFPRSAKFGILLLGHSVKHGAIEEREGAYHASFFFSSFSFFAIDSCKD